MIVHALHRFNLLSKPTALRRDDVPPKEARKAKPTPFTGMMFPQKEARKSKPLALYRDDESSESR